MRNAFLLGCFMYSEPSPTARYMTSNCSGFTFCKQQLARTTLFKIVSMSSTRFALKDCNVDDTSSVVRRVEIDLNLWRGPTVMPVFKIASVRIESGIEPKFS